MYIGHQSLDGREQPLAEHLENVAKLAGTFASAFGAQALGEYVGKIHDIGKYSDGGQARMHGGDVRIDHATAGGKESDALTKGTPQAMLGRISAYCAMGHHGGLPDGGSPLDTGDMGTLYGRLQKQVADYAAFKKEIALPVLQLPDIKPLGRGGFSISFLTRMLFSCLVDADYLDTERFMTHDAVQRGGYESIKTLHDQFEKHMERFKNPEKAINQMRCQILSECIQNAIWPKGLYTLTVPTGGGKTLASMAFALNHAVQHGARRIIYVIPYLSIIEQTADVFKAILGAQNVLEHHSNVTYDNDESGTRKHLSAENFDAPIILTTAVQFFESLYACRTSKCRKLHNLANSVIILDEAQMMPLQYLKPCVRAIEELAANYRCTAVMCTATQPAIKAFFSPGTQMREIMSAPQDLYRFFRRTTIDSIGPITDSALAARLSDHDQALCIVSTRKQAHNLFHLLPPENTYHLTTLMYPSHRRKVLAEIRQRLQNHLPCRVVSTSLIEAGVDLDFPVVYRALSGLDSILQAAGRCNREGKQDAADSRVYVFEPEECYRIPTPMRRFGETFRIIARHQPDIASPDAISAYFEKLYDLEGSALDSYRILERLENGMKGLSFPFKEIAKAFHLIDTKTQAVLIPLEDMAQDFCIRLRTGERSRELLRGAAQYSVNVYEQHLKELIALGAVERLDEELFVLCDLTQYDVSTGLTPNAEGGRGIFT